LQEQFLSKFRFGNLQSFHDGGVKNKTKKTKDKTKIKKPKKNQKK